MSTAWREHIHGQIEPLDDCRPRDWREIATFCVVFVAITAPAASFALGYWSF